jgi:CRISPR-associated protein Cmr4
MGETGMLFIHALTGLHPGSGAAVGVVDLPVQRERHTQWPMIQGSSLKGVLRDACRRKSKEEKDKFFTVFGPDTDDAGAHAGALALTDARILAFPVRSLRGVFAWITCPAVLERLDRDLELTRGPKLNKIPDVRKEQAAYEKSSDLNTGEDKLILEEFEFTCSGSADYVANWIADHAVKDEATQKRLKSHLAVLHDDDFSHFVCHATEVSARIGLDYQTKTVEGGALFYEEFLPPETLFYSIVLAEDGRRDKSNISAAKVMEYLKGNMPDFLQIGGNETIGKGICAVRMDRALGEGEAPAEPDSPDREGVKHVSTR